MNRKRHEGSWSVFGALCRSGQWSGISDQDCLGVSATCIYFISTCRTRVVYLSKEMAFLFMSAWLRRSNVEGCCCRRAYQSENTAEHLNMSSMWQETWMLLKNRDVDPLTTITVVEQRASAQSVDFYNLPCWRGKWGVFSIQLHNHRCVLSSISSLKPN